MAVPSQLGPFRLLRELSRGGMGAVFEAEHQQTGGRYALKVILSDGLRGFDPEMLARFRREAEALGSLNHPNVVHVHAADLDGPVPYLVQDLLTGGTLEQRLKRGPLAVAEAIGVVRKLASGLAAAHALGILHRDLKPENVLFDERGEPRLVDFGLTRDEASPERLTKTGELLGTPAYMSPEQARGEGGVGVASDVYGLGAVLYAALTGRPPAQGGSVLATLAAVVEARVRPPGELRPDIPPGVEAACLRALSKDPADRYATATGFAEGLLAAPVRPPAGGGRLALAGLALAVLAGALALALAGGREDEAIPPSSAPPPSRRDALAAARADAQAALRDGDAGAALAAIASAVAAGLGSPVERELSGLAHLLAGDLPQAEALLRGRPAYRAVAVERGRQALAADVLDPLGEARPNHKKLESFRAADRLIESARVLEGVPQVGAQLTLRVQETVADALVRMGTSFVRPRQQEAFALLDRAIGMQEGAGAGAARVVRAAFEDTLSKENSGTTTSEEAREWAEAGLASPGLGPRWRAFATSLKQLSLPGQPLFEPRELAVFAPDDLSNLETHLYARVYRIFAHRWYGQLLGAIEQRDSPGAALAWRYATTLLARSQPHVGRTTNPHGLELVVVNLATLQLMALRREEAAALLQREFAPKYRPTAELLRLEVSYLQETESASLEEELNEVLNHGAQANDPRLWCLRAAVRFRRGNRVGAELDLTSLDLIKGWTPPDGMTYRVTWRTREETRAEVETESGLRAFLAKALRTH